MQFVDYSLYMFEYKDISLKLETAQPEKDKTRSLIYNFQFNFLINYPTLCASRISNKLWS